MLSFEEKRDLVGKVDDLSKNDKISIKEACNRLDVPYWKYHAVIKSIKNGKKKARTKANTLVAPTVNGDLRVEMVFKGDTAKLVREYSETYCVEPDVACRIMVIDTLKGKK